MGSPLKNALLGATALLLISTGSARAQVGTLSNMPTVALTATKEATLTVTPTTAVATLASITDNSNANVFTPVGITTDWNLTAGSSVHLIGWFATPAQALANGSDFIPSSRGEGRVNATAFAPFTGAAVGGVGVAGGSLQLFNQAVAAGSF
ncbi:MAG: hypothetical protein K0S19_249, partial [Geminicoccaceae bacterium]|nr:hypothetical protein [Geminicoccaceae bacterium]